MTTHVFREGDIVKFREDNGDWALVDMTGGYAQQAFGREYPEDTYLVGLSLSRIKDRDEDLIDEIFADIVVPLIHPDYREFYMKKLRKIFEWGV